MSNKINTLLTPSFTYCNISNPGPLKRGRGRNELFSSVNLSMVVKIAGHRESFGTYYTHIGLFSSVLSNVNFYLIRSRESLVTLGAGKRFLPGVNSHVSPQMC